MIAAFLITFREILEASLIVATILSILTKLEFTSSKKTVWIAAGAALLSSVFLLVIGSIFGFEVQEIFEEHEALFEGIVMIVSALFITWAVFFLHKTFAQHKLTLLQKVRSTIQTNEQKALFLLVFTAVFREGLEIVLFLSTLFFSSQPIAIGTGFILGTGSAIVLSYLLFTTTIKMPIYKTFKATSILLILFAAGLLAHGFHELTEAKIIPEMANLPTITLYLLPEKNSIIGSVIRSIFGISRVMHSSELLLWCIYAFTMWNTVIRRIPTDN